MNPYSTTRTLLDSIGVNTHLSYTDTPYGNVPLVLDAIRELGIYHIRDGCHGLPNLDAFSCYCAPFVELAKQGVKFDCVIDPSENLGTINSQLLYQFYIGYASAIESYEGWNEPDAGTPVGWPFKASQWQDVLYQQANMMPQQVKSLPVVACALADAAANASSLGSVASYCDFGNLHPYPAGKAPEPVLQAQIPYARQMCGIRPIWVTETGYFTGPQGDPAANGQPSVSMLAAAKYTLRILLDNFASGVPKTYLYELLDETATNGWGMVNSVGLQKQSFTAVSNLAALLAGGDPHAIAQPLNVSIDNGVRSLFLQVGNGSWLLFLWNPLTVYDLQTHTDIVNPSVPINIRLSAPMNYKVYVPLVQRIPCDAGQSQTITVWVPDHPICVLIEQ